MSVRPAKTQPGWASTQSDQCLPLRSVGNQGPELSSCGQRRLWSDWADAEADLSLRLAHMPFCWFSHEAAHLPVLQRTNLEAENGYNRVNSNQLSRLVAKPTKWHVRPAKTQISLGIRPVWSESSLCAQWVAKDPSFLHADSEDSDHTWRHSKTPAIHIMRNKCFWKPQLYYIKVGFSDLSKQLTLFLTWWESTYISVINFVRSTGTQNIRKNVWCAGIGKQQTSQTEPVVTPRICCGHQAEDAQRSDTQSNRNITKMMGPNSYIILKRHFEL